MENKVSQVERVRTHPSSSNQPQTANQKDKIPGGCITMRLIISAKHLTKAYIDFAANSKFVC